MSKEFPSKEAFEKLLRWLDSDREKAGEKHERIRLRLIRVFAARGCGEPEDLADETINVVASRIDWLLENYEGDPALYFYGVAKKIHLEHFKKKNPPDPPPAPDKSEIEQECECLERCLEQLLTPEDRRLVLRYYEKSKKQKIAIRKQLAKELGISINALRIKVHHIVVRLRPCIDRCLRDLRETL
jgi:DNA-directed RNA polymerase specialized sigma24 family protein